MSTRVIIRPEAEADLSAAFHWYEETKAGLGYDFLAQVHTMLSLIAENPLRFAIVHNQARRALIRRFP